MPTPKLDDALKAYYESVEPSPAVVRTATTATSVRRLRRWAVVGAAAAAAALALQVGQWVNESTERSRPALAVRLADEVWAQYTHLKPPDVVGRSFETIAAGLPRLDFELHPPGRMMDGVPVGGRYCSLDGQLAAQVIMRNEQGRRSTLYVTRDGPRFETIDHHRFERANGYVRVWREAGLVYAFASLRAGTGKSPARKTSAAPHP